ncbi:DUF4383 domain-containing protein [Saccharomonospora viridis]|jgi:hypothetical protein|uniref:DUF4383 domain-containing protein n=1 Tax=Saccharomonospora viridis TaxID=1852 RepID=UPI00056A62E1|nr:DUF4383 domain-containing protein [Saccharomonospora viridis]SFP79707.1 protein of unknown function [Saccharomonospora viridis]
MRLLREPRLKTNTARIVVGVVGLWYLALGVAGFVVSSQGMGADTSRGFWVFGTSTMLNLGYLLMGVVALTATRSNRTLHAFGWLSFLAFLGFFVYGIFAATVSSLGNVANVRIANVVMYGVTAAVGLFLMLMPYSEDRRAP